ncbi:MAG TPA: hypothetical protein VNV61_07955 [Steroidobacteraceae bacterium]|jgi:hypothetical protein|nr:hypothetical protein [Steroidobacteraceae bacterium]
MKNLVTIVGWIAYAVVGIIQIFVTVDGVKYFTGLGSFAARIIAMFTGWIPILGTAFGIYGARKAWDWTLTNAFLLFVGIPGFFLILGLIVVAAGTAMAKRKSA